MSEQVDLARYTVEHNGDGSAVVRLREPIKFTDKTGRTDQLSRLTIPRICGRHMRSATWNLFERPTLGQAMAWAADIVEPVGVLDELEANLARDIAMEVSLILVKKSRSTGEAP